jgi:hypothetical protein
LKSPTPIDAMTLVSLSSSDPSCVEKAYDRRDYPRIIYRRKNITNITVINNRVVNRSIEVTNIERVTRKRVQRVKVEEADRPDRIRQKGHNTSTMFGG